jgi:hypothetical protein
VSGEASSELGDDEGTEAAKRSLIPLSPSNVNQFEFVKRELLINKQSIINQLLIQAKNQGCWSTIEARKLPIRFISQTQRRYYHLS